MDFNTVSTLIISIAYVVACIVFAVYSGLSLATNIVNIIRTQKKEQWLTFFGSISTPGSFVINLLCFAIALLQLLAQILYGIIYVYGISEDSVMWGSLFMNIFARLGFIIMNTVYPGLISLIIVLKMMTDNLIRFRILLLVTFTVTFVCLTINIISFILYILGDFYSYQNYAFKFMSIIAELVNDALYLVMHGLLLSVIIVALVFLIHYRGFEHVQLKGYILSINLAIGSFIQVILYIIFSLIYLVAVNYGLQGVDPFAASVVMLICEIIFKVLIFVQMVHIFISVFPFFINQSSLLNIQNQYQKDAHDTPLENPLEDKRDSERSQAIDADTVMIKSGALYEPDTDHSFKPSNSLEAEDIELQ